MIQKAIKKLNSDGNLKELLSGSAVTFGFKMIGMFLGYILIYIISKKNGANGVGVYSLFRQSIVLASVFLGLGLNISVLRYIGQFNNDKERSNYHYLYRFIIKFVAPTSIVLGAVLFFFSEEIATLLGRRYGYNDFISILGITLPFFALNQIGIEFIRGLKRLQISEFVRSVLRPIVMVSSLIIFWNRDVSNTKILYLFMIGAILAWCISSATIINSLRSIPKAPIVNFSGKQLAKTSAPMLITSVSSTLLVSLPFFFIDFFVSSKDVGLFSVPFQLAQLISIVLVVVNTIAAPKFSELFWSNKKTELHRLIRQSSKIMFWTSLILCLLLIFVGEWVLNFFGKEFVGGEQVLIYLVIGQFVNVASGSVGVLMNMTGEQKALQIILMITVVISITLMSILVPRYGITGGALSVMITMIFQNVIAVIYMWRKSDFITVYIPFIRLKR
ncbi:MAG: flippase [Crocinitomicaceae bacterium]|nr:flippase [Crocinitomicaceae bacterium]